MRSLVLLATILALPSSGLAEPRRERPLPMSDSPARTDCLDGRVRHAGPAAPDRLRGQRLGELPPGDLHLAVVRKVDGCQEPVIVRYDVGRARR